MMDDPQVSTQQVPVQPSVQPKSKNVQMPDGSVIAFPSTMSDDEINQEGAKWLLSKGYGEKGTQPPPNANELVHSGLKFTPAVLAAGGGLVGGVPGAALGSVAGIELQNEFPKLFGQAPNDAPGFATRIGGDALMQGIMPNFGGGLAQDVAESAPAALINRTPLKNMPAVRQGAAAEMTRQGLAKYSFPETGILESAAQNASDVKQGMIDAYKEAKVRHQVSDAFANGQASSPEMNDIAGQHESIFGGNEVGNNLVKLNKEFQAGPGQAATQTYKSISNQALSDVAHVRNFKLATGEPTTIEQLAINDLMTDSFKASKGELNAESMLDKLGGKKSEVYSEAIAPDKLNRLKDFASTLQEQEKKGITDTMLRYSNGHLVWAAPAALGALGEMAGGHGGGLLGITVGGGAAGFTLTNKMLGSLMKNPETAALVVQAMKTSTNAPEANFLNQMVAHSLRAVGAGVSGAANQ